MPVTISNVQEAKSGRSLRVLIGNSWYGAYKDSGLKAGMVIEPELGTLDKGGPWVLKWKLAEGTTVPSPQNTPPDPQNAPQRTGSSMMAAPYWMPYVSNVTAHAIQAGLIKTPQDIGQWAKAAAETAIALEALG